MAEKIGIEAIAPCGFDCALCMAFQKKKNERGACSGCRAQNDGQQKHCARCTIRHCPELLQNGLTYCFSCKKFPCRRLRELDAKYQKSNGISMLERLLRVETCGIEAFLRDENAAFLCPHCENPVCIHKSRCLHCN